MLGWVYGRVHGRVILTSKNQHRLDILAQAEQQLYYVGSFIMKPYSYRQKTSLSSLSTESHEQVKRRTSLRTAIKLVHILGLHSCDMAAVQGDDFSQH